MLYRTSWKRTLTILSTSLFLALSIPLSGCKPSAESIEKWRNAEGGVEKLTTYAEDKSLSIDLREKAFEIIVEEAVSVLEVMNVINHVDITTKKAFADKVYPIIKKKWDLHDFPSEADVKKKGRMNVAGSQAVLAKDLAYQLVPYSDGEAHTGYVAILDQWLDGDYQLRNQLGSSTLGQVAEYASKKGTEALFQWVVKSEKPGSTVLELKRHLSEETMLHVGELLNKRALEEYPNISKSLGNAILIAGNKALIPYVERVLRDPEAPANLFDDALDLYVKLQGAKASDLLIDLVKERPGQVRWIAIDRLLSLRGKSGFLIVADALPTDIKGYKSDLELESRALCRHFVEEMKKMSNWDYQKEVENALESPDWPKQLLALRCIEVAHLTDLAAKIEPLLKSKTKILNWGEERKKTTIGDIAKSVKDSLSK